MRKFILSLFLFGFLVIPFRSFSQYNELNCYYISGGRLYNNAAHTLPTGGITAAAQCPVFSGVPYFYPYTVTGVGAALCYAVGGGYYKVACPLDDYSFLLVVISGMVVVFSIKKYKFCMMI